jgi:hypothetical protein
MANSFTYQVIKDTTEQVVIKLTGYFDGSGQESNSARIAANSLYGALDANNVPLRSSLSQSNTAKPFYGMALNKFWYDCGSGGDVQLYWTADTNVPLVILNGNGEFDGGGSWTTIPNNAFGASGCNGNIGIVTRGMAANDSYTILLDFRKHNEYYQRGQFNDPAAFNFGDYSMRPAP